MTWRGSAPSSESMCACGLCVSDCLGDCAWLCGVDLNLGSPVSSALTLCRVCQSAGSGVGPGPRRMAPAAPGLCVPGSKRRRSSRYPCVPLYLCLSALLCLSTLSVPLSLCLSVLLCHSAPSAPLSLCLSTASVPLSHRVHCTLAFFLVLECVMHPPISCFLGSSFALDLGCSCGETRPRPLPHPLARSGKRAQP